jgi:hypothetical protein
MGLGCTNFPPRFGPGLLVESPPWRALGGKTPELRALLNYHNLSTISGAAQAGKLYMLAREQPTDGKEVVSFLRHVLREVSGKPAIHRRTSSSPGKAADGFLREGASQRLHLEQLPGYALDLNPDEVEPGRKRLELPQERGDEEPLLPEPRPPQNRASKSEGAAPPQDPDHQELPGSWVGLDISSHIGEWSCHS